MKRILIIGGGFGGLALAKALRDSPFEVLLVDKNNYHTFQPLLYQVATAGLEPDSIATPFRDIFKHQSNFRFRLAEVRKIDPALKTVETSLGPLSYDDLVIATGSETNFYGMNDIQKNAFPMKSIPEAMMLRNLFLERLELSLSETDPHKKRALMTIVIIGGGPTGVELAGALGELKKKILPLDYPELNMEEWEIYVVDMVDRLLSTMSIQASKAAETGLEKFGIKFLFNSRVQAYDGNEVVFAEGKKIPSKTLIWTAGVRGNILEGLGKDVAVKGRIQVNAFNRLETDPHIFVIGDVAHQPHENASGYPMLAPVAIQQAHCLARNLIRREQNRPMKTFHYKNPGVMATIGRNHGVVDLNWLKINGVAGWLIWLFVHLMALVGFRNRLVAFVNWMWSYFTYNRGLRIILRQTPRPSP